MASTPKLKRSFDVLMRSMPPPVYYRKRNHFVKAFGGKCGKCREHLRFIETRASSSFLCELDHFVPKRHGGEDNLYNLWPLCPCCHAEKTKMEIGEPWCVICGRYGEHSNCCFRKFQEENFNHEKFFPATTATEDWKEGKFYRYRYHGEVWKEKYEKYAPRDDVEKSEIEITS